MFAVSSCIVIIDGVTMPLIKLTDRFIACTRNDALLSLSEGFVKVRLLEAALSLGWTIQEGVREQKLADYGSVRLGKLAWLRADRRINLTHGSVDVTIVNPFQLLIELKTVPDYGPKSAGAF